MYLIIGADLVPTSSNIELFLSGDKKRLIGEELEIVLSDASYRIFNLEVPLTDEENPIIKNGPNLIAPTNTVEGYRALGADLLTLANNHIMDQGDQGLRSTINVLDGNGINHFGAGRNLNEASAPFIFTFAGRQIGMYACVEHEFSVASESTPGSNPFDPLYSLDHVQELKNRTDYVIVLYHGGKEHYRYPSPMLQKACRRLVDKGANLVVCQHSHCIGCEEKYENGTIIYGQGNFLFDHSDNECWQTGLLIKIEEDFSISYVPVRKSGLAVTYADKESSRQIIEAFRTRSEEIKQKGFIEQSFKAFSDNYIDFYLEAFSGENGIPFRAINKATGGEHLKRTLKKKYTDIRKIALLNYIDCEAHREVLLQSLKDSIERI